MARKKSSKMRKCIKGYSCGYSCIARGKKCKNRLDGQEKTYAEWLKKNLKAEDLSDFHKFQAKELGLENNWADHWTEKVWGAAWANTPSDLRSAIDAQESRPDLVEPSKKSKKTKKNSIFPGRLKSYVHEWILP